MGDRGRTDKFSARKEEIEQKIQQLERRVEAVQSSFYQCVSPSQESSITRSSSDSKDSLFDGLFVEAFVRNEYQFYSGTDEEESLEVVIQNTKDVILQTDMEGTIESVNPMMQKVFGYHESDLQGRTVFDLISSEYRSLLKSMYETLETKPLGESIDGSRVLTALSSSGEKINLESILFSYMRDDVRKAALVLRDIHVNKEMISELESLKNQYAALSETLYDGILQINEEFEILFANTAVERLFGYTKNELIGSNFRVLFPEELQSRYFPDFQKYFIVDENDRREIGIKNTLEVICYNSAKEPTLYEVSFGNSRGLHNQRTLTCVMRDITERKNAERRLRNLAFYDRLTNAGNRDLFSTDIRKLIKTKKEENSLAALLFIDLDNFKRINDTLGHSAGDELLVQASHRVRDCLRENDMLYRWGGDEFVVLLDTIKKVDDAAHVAERILSAVSASYTVNSENNSQSSVNVGASIGISIIPQDGQTPTDLLRNTDIAMYRSKDSGKNQYTFFDKQMNTEELEKWNLEKGLRSVIAQKKLQVYYQPLVDSNGSIKGAEALVRWQKDDGTFIPPDRFIPLAEERNLINQVGDLVLETLCHDLSRWNKKHPDLYVSYNVSARQFDDDAFVEKIGASITKYGLDPHNLYLEITESSVMQSPVSSIQKLEALKKRYPGMKVSIDDFGTGYSSLTYLSTLPADVLKIDQSFILSLEKGNNRRIVDMIIGLAHTMGLKVVAEGVELREQVEYLREKNCQILQGYYFRKPVPSQEFTTLLGYGSLPR